MIQSDFRINEYMERMQNFKNLSASLDQLNAYLAYSSFDGERTLHSMHIWSTVYSRRRSLLSTFSCKIAN